MPLKKILLLQKNLLKLIIDNDSETENFYILSVIKNVRDVNVPLVDKINILLIL